MPKYGRRTFPKNAGQGSLAAAVALSLPGSAMLRAQERSRQAERESQSKSADARE